MFTQKHLLIAAVAMSALSALSAQAQTLKPTIDLNTAKAIAQGCEDASKREGWKMNIAVMDTGGNLVHFTHMDDAYILSIRIAQLKAQTSAQSPLPTRTYREYSKSAIGLELIPNTTTIAGGLPIMNSKGQQLGGVGVSGGSEDQDENCAKAGLEAAKALLK